MIVSSPGVSIQMPVMVRCRHPLRGCVRSARAHFDDRRRRKSKTPSEIAAQALFLSIAVVVNVSFDCGTQVGSRMDYATLQLWRSGAEHRSARS